MRMTPPLAPLASALVIILTASAGAGAQSDFQWRGVIPAGDAIEIRGVNGNVTATRAPGNEVRVVANKSARRSDPDEVRIEVVEHAGGVTICAVYPTPPRSQPNECRPGGGRHSTENNDVRVDFTVEIPAAVAFLGRTTNGNVAATGLASDASLRTTNGNIRLETSGTGNARTTNGRIDAVLGRADWDGTAEFRTTNGNVTLSAPSGLNADLRARTTNGRIDSDFPVLVRGTISRRSLNGVIGDGGRTLQVRTTNGSIRLREQ
jgi:hypothetical protein